MRIVQNERLLMTSGALGQPSSAHMELEMTHKTTLRESSALYLTSDMAKLFIAKGGDGSGGRNVKDREGARTG